MRARVFRVFKDNRHTLEYYYVNTAKCRDDVEAWYRCSVCTPMMEIRLFKDENTHASDRLCVLATPEIIRKYTGFDIFNEKYTYYMEDRVLDIEFEWKEIDYPYFEKPEYRDYIKADKVRFPIISKIEEVVLEW